MAEPTEGIGAATGSRRGAFSPQNAREGRAQGDTSGKHTGMRKRAGTAILKANGATILKADGATTETNGATILNANGATTETDGDNNRSGWGNNDNSRAYKKPQDCS